MMIDYLIDWSNEAGVAGERSSLRCDENWTTGCDWKLVEQAMVFGDGWKSAVSLVSADGL